MSDSRPSGRSDIEILNYLRSIEALEDMDAYNGFRKWTNGMALQGPAVNYKKCSDYESLLCKCKAFLCAINDSTSNNYTNAIIDCALHVCLPNRHEMSEGDNFQLKFLLFDYWTPDGSDTNFVSVDLEKSKTPDPNMIDKNKQWWELIEKNPKAAIIGITGIAFSLIRLAIKGAVGFKTLYENNTRMPSISKKISVHTSIRDIPETIEFSEEILDSIAHCSFRQCFSALKAILAPALEFKRDLAKKKPNADPVTDSYLDMLAMQSLRLIGMQPVKLLEDISRIYKIKELEILDLLTPYEPMLYSIKKMKDFYLENKSDNPDPAAEWSRCIAHGYSAQLSARNNSEFYGALVSIYLNAYPNTDILNSPAAKKIGKIYQYVS